MANSVSTVVTVPCKFVGFDITSLRRYTVTRDTASDITVLSAHTDGKSGIGVFGIQYSGAIDHTLILKATATEICRYENIRGFNNRIDNLVHFIEATKDFVVNWDQNITSACFYLQYCRYAYPR